MCVPSGPRSRSTGSPGSRARSRPSAACRRKLMDNPVPWRLIGERVAVTVAAGEVRIRHGMREVAVHRQSQGRRLRIVDSSHLDVVAGRNGAVCRAEIVASVVPASSQAPSLLRPLAEYEAAIGGGF
ncbi:Mu transposase domain-containing protein [Mesorhizobium captivum]|uniref:Mu transposase domain-containing protein n=1 Tax=Mesorhizobium captivum TaxID=3072319 RepID=UPI003D314526